MVLIGSMFGIALPIRTKINENKPLLALTLNIQEHIEVYLLKGYLVRFAIAVFELWTFRDSFSNRMHST